MSSDPIAEFIEAASVPRDAAHTSGSLERADALLRASPWIPERSIHAAAVVGDADAVRRHLEGAPERAREKGGPRGWDPLTYLCFSRYLRLERARGEGFVASATSLLDAGASARTGWMEPAHRPEPEWESAIYGAAGVAHHPELTRLLIARGADPNDNETPYHAPETYDNAALEVLVESGRLTPDSLATMLLRKADWHDTDGVVYLLEQGADPNRMTVWGYTALQQALRRDNEIAIVAAMLEHGGDPRSPTRAGPWGTANRMTGIAIAAWRGRGDALRLFDQHEKSLDLTGADGLIAACARGDDEAARAIGARDPVALTRVRAVGGTLLAHFAGVGNDAGLRALLELGIPVDAPYEEGDGYYQIAPRSTALHVAAWRARHETVTLLLERGADANARDAHGRTPLQLAARAAVDSYWTDRRAPDSVRALLRAGAQVRGIARTGYAAVDELLDASRST